MTVVTVILLLVTRIAFAKRPVLLGCRTLLVVIGAAALTDLLLGLRDDATPTGPLLALVAIAAAYRVAGRTAVLFRASLTELDEALSRSGRMIRLEVEGGPDRYRLSSGGASATLAVFSRLGRYHALVFGAAHSSKKTSLFRTVVAKQFGGLIPILIRVRS